MDKLEIPERAYAAADQLNRGDEHKLIEAAAPIIVAAAFRRFAEVATCEQDRSLAQKIAGELDPEGVEGG